MDSTQNITATSLEDLTPVTFNWGTSSLHANTAGSTATTISSGPYGASYGSLLSTNAIYTTGSSLSATKITLNGEDADVEVNGWSLVAAVKRIEERLGLFQPNPKLESEWEDLRALGEQYRNLEQRIKDKQATWDRLKAMPAPNID